MVPVYDTQNFLQMSPLFSHFKQLFFLLASSSVQMCHIKILWYHCKIWKQETNGYRYKYRLYYLTVFFNHLKTQRRVPDKELDHFLLKVTFISSSSLPVNFP